MASGSSIHPTSTFIPENNFESPIVPTQESQHFTVKLYFKKIRNFDGSFKVICNYCSQVFKFQEVDIGHLESILKRNIIRKANLDKSQVPNKPFCSFFPRKKS